MCFRCFYTNVSYNFTIIKSSPCNFKSCCKTRADLGIIHKLDSIKTFYFGEKFMNYSVKNRWIVLLGALSAQMTIGAMYAWSMFNEPIKVAFGCELSDVVRTYGIALAAFSLTTILSGRLQQKKGPRVTALIGSFLYCGGILLSSLATTPQMLYLTYGVMAGAGVGFIYVCPLATLVKWFPNHKGGITGVATGAFAMGAFIFKFVIKDILHLEDGQVYTTELISDTFLSLGIIYTIMAVIGSLLLDVPKDAKAASKVKVVGDIDYSPMQMIKTGNFYKLLFSDLLALMPGLLIIGIAKDLGTSWFDATTGGWLVALLALFNAGGRLASGKLADLFGALRVYRIMYLFVIIALAVLSSHPTSKVIFIIALLVIAVGYGSFLSLVPTMVGRIFGGKNFNANYGLVFQAYGMAAMIGITIKSYCKEDFGLAFTIAMATAIGGLILAMLIKNEMHVHKEPVKNLE